MSAARGASRAAWAVLPTAALLELNGLYTGAAHRAGEGLFWSLDALQFVLVPLASVWALARFGGVRPRDYGLGPIAGGQSGPAALLTYALLIVVFAYGYALARILALFVPQKPPLPAAEEGKGVLAGVRFVLRDRLLTTLACTSLLANAFGQMLSAGLPVLAFE